MFETNDNYTPRKLYMPMKLQFFAEGAGDGGDGGTGDGTGDGDGGAEDDQPFAVFKTSEELNKRLARAEKKGHKNLLQELGFNSMEELQVALSKDKKDEQQNQDNKDQDGDKAPDVKTIVDEAIKTEREKTFKRVVTAEVKLTASELGFADWEDAYALADLSGVKEDDKGNITGIKEALQALAEKKPHLIKQKAASGGFGADAPNRQQANRQQSLEEVKKMAQNRGVTANAPYNPWAN